MSNFPEPSNANDTPLFDALLQGSESGSVEEEGDLFEVDPHPEQVPDCHVIDLGIDGQSLQSDPD